VYFMSTACGRPHGGEGEVRSMWTRGGVKTGVFGGRHKWMARPLTAMVFDFCFIFSDWNLTNQKSKI